MISSLSSVGCAQVSAPALRHAQRKEFGYKQKQELGCLGGGTYVCNAGTTQTEQAGA